MSIRYEDNVDKIREFVKTFARAGTDLDDTTEELWLQIVEPILDEVDMEMAELESKLEELEDELETVEMEESE